MSDCLLLDTPINAHPDRKPHKKACEVCALRPSNPQQIDDATWEQFYFDADMIGAEFYCNHRTEDGFHRICACFAALYGIKQAQVGFAEVDSDV